MAVRTRTKRAATRKSTTGTRKARPATARRTAKRTTTRTTTKMRRAGRRAPSAKRGAGGLSQKVRPDVMLAAVVGGAAVARTQLVKKFWDYVKAQGLQSKTDRRKINSDEKLRPLFGGRRQVSMFEVPALLARHAR